VRWVRVALALVARWRVTPAGLAVVPGAASVAEPGWPGVPTEVAAPGALAPGGIVLGLPPRGAPVVVSGVWEGIAPGLAVAGPPAVGLGAAPVWASAPPARPMTAIEVSISLRMRSP
jgi:hypothetical protein